MKVLLAFTWIVVAVVALLTFFSILIAKATRAIEEEDA